MDQFAIVQSLILTPVCLPTSRSAPNQVLLESVTMSLDVPCGTLAQAQSCEHCDHSSILFLLHDAPTAGPSYHKPRHHVQRHFLRQLHYQGWKTQDVKDCGTAGSSCWLYPKVTLGYWNKSECQTVSIGASSTHNPSKLACTVMVLAVGTAGASHLTCEPRQS